MLVPSASVVYPENVPAGAPQIDEKGIIWKRVAAQPGRPTEAGSLMSCPTLTEHKEEYLYYRTDHHWTSAGGLLRLPAVL